LKVNVGQQTNKRNPHPDGSPKTKKLMNSFETWMKKKDLYTIVDPLIRPLDNPATTEGPEQEPGV
jgi:hypothetical protein